MPEAIKAFDKVYELKPTDAFKEWLDEFKASVQ